ncbi:dicarboxylate/amino acid:cation symporter [Hutsoniella sourekii]
MNILALIIVLALFGVIYQLSKRGANFTTKVLTATALGAIVGLIFAGHTEYVAVFGRIYASLLKAIVVPLLFFSIINTVASLEDTRSLTTIGSKTIGVLSMHNILSSILAIAVGLLLGVGRNSHIPVPETAEVREIPSFVDAFVSFFPSNIVEHAANNQVIPIIVFSLLIGIGIISFQDKEEIKPFVDFIRAGNDVIFNVVGMVTRFTPYAVLALLADAVGKFDAASLGALLLVLVAVYVASLFHSFVTTGALVAVLGRVNPWIFIKKFLPAWLIAFSTQSSVGSIPANVNAQKSMGVPEKIATFAASIGTTFGMPGCASIWPILLAIFTINTLGIEFTIWNYLYMIVVALLVSVGTVGVPGTAIITATLLFTSIGLPVEMIIVLTPISAVADMARTATNVIAGGSTGLITAALEGDLDREIYQAQEVSLDSKELAADHR